MEIRPTTLRYSAVVIASVLREALSANQPVWLSMKEIASSHATLLAMTSDLKMLTALVPEGVPRGRGTERFHGLW